MAMRIENNFGVKKRSSKNDKTKKVPATKSPNLMDHISSGDEEKSELHAPSVKSLTAGKSLMKDIFKTDVVNEEEIAATVGEEIKISHSKISLNSDIRDEGIRLALSLKLSSFLERTRAMSEELDNYGMKNDLEKIRFEIQLIGLQFQTAMMEFEVYERHRNTKNSHRNNYTKILRDSGNQTNGPIPCDCGISRKDCCFLRGLYFKMISWLYMRYPMVHEELDELLDANADISEKPQQVKAALQQEEAELIKQVVKYKQEKDQDVAKEPAGGILKDMIELRAVMSDLNKRMQQHFAGSEVKTETAPIIVQQPEVVQKLFASEDEKDKKERRRRAKKERAEKRRKEEEGIVTKPQQSKEIEKLYNRRYELYENLETRKQQFERVAKVEQEEIVAETSQAYKLREQQQKVVANTEKTVQEQQKQQKMMNEIMDTLVPEMFKRLEQVVKQKYGKEAILVNEQQQQEEKEEDKKDIEQHELIADMCKDLNIVEQQYSVGQAELGKVVSQVFRAQEQVFLQKTKKKVNTKTGKVKEITKDVVEQDVLEYVISEILKRLSRGQELNIKNVDPFLIATVYVIVQLLITTLAKLVKNDTKQENKQENVETSTTKVSEQKSKAESKEEKSQKKAQNKQKKEKPARVSTAKQTVKYINDIVIEYLGSEKAMRDARLHCYPDLPLKQHAEKLVKAGLGYYVTKQIRINKKNNTQAFIELNADRESLERDAIIPLKAARKYAKEGDTVYAFVMNRKPGEVTKWSKRLDLHKYDKPSETSEDCFEEEELAELAEHCPKAFVIEIVKSAGPKEIIGHVNLDKKEYLSHTHGTSTPFYVLKPLDMRYDKIYIPLFTMVPKPNPQLRNTVYIYSAVVSHIDDFGYHIGTFRQLYGESLDTRATLKAILQLNGLGNLTPYSADMIEQITQQLALKQPVPQDGRADLTELCIFTIDPATARDLDDALSCELVEHGVYEVGVHISDVSYYLRENSELDNIVKKRCTSIYLVNEVIHMLPEVLCQHCSLLPNETKYAFSIFWQITINGEVKTEPQITRSLIRSCCQLAYEDAQHIIDHGAYDDMSEHTFPTIYGENNNLEEIKSRVLALNTIARSLRRKRFNAGALSINNPKLRFKFDESTMEPVSYELEQRKSANFMIEEFMLLANQTVAKYIYKRYPNIAILRNHDPPLLKSMRLLAEKLSHYDILIDYRTSKTLQRSIIYACRESSNAQAMDALLSAMLMKPMARAKYFCSYAKSADELRHYALSIPIYTHFTSPIRRYPDVLVHRLLAAALKYSKKPKRSVEELNEIVQKCNEQHFKAKNASDESTLECFKRYVLKNKNLQLNAVIMDIMHHMMNVVVIETGHTVTVRYRNQELNIDAKEVPKSVKIKDNNSELPAIRVTVGSAVPIKLTVRKNKLMATLMMPEYQQPASNEETD